MVNFKKSMIAVFGATALPGATAIYVGSPPNLCVTTMSPGGDDTAQKHSSKNPDLKKCVNEDPAELSPTTSLMESNQSVGLTDYDTKVITVMRYAKDEEKLKADHELVSFVNQCPLPNDESNAELEKFKKSLESDDLKKHAYKVLKEHVEKFLHNGEDVVPTPTKDKVYVQIISDDVEGIHNDEEVEIWTKVLTYAKYSDDQIHKIIGHLKAEPDLVLFVSQCPLPNDESDAELKKLKNHAYGVLKEHVDEFLRNLVDEDDD